MSQYSPDVAMHAPTEAASPWVARFVDLIPTNGEVLDLACGSGRHARLLAAHGYAVLAVDRNRESLALAAGEGITTLSLDLESDDADAWPFESRRFTGIVVTNYLHRPLWASMMDSLAPGGVLIYETFALGNEQFGKPSNPAFLLGRGELLALAQGSGVQILAFEDGYVTMPKSAMVQRICVRKPGKLPAPENLYLN